MKALHDIRVNTSVVLGTARVPIGDLLKMGRGAIITLEGSADQPSHLHVNGKAIASGTIMIRDDRIVLEVAELCSGGAA